MIRILVTGLLFAVMQPAGAAQEKNLLPVAKTDCSSCTIYRSYVSGNMELWKKGMQELQEQFGRSKDACTLYTHGGGTVRICRVSPGKG
jgi:hypothetical protein